MSEFRIGALTGALIFAGVSAYMAYAQGWISPTLTLEPWKIIIMHAGAYTFGWGFFTLFVPDPSK